MFMVKVALRMLLSAEFSPVLVVSALSILGRSQFYHIGAADERGDSETSSSRSLNDDVFRVMKRAIVLHFDFFWRVFRRTVGGCRSDQGCEQRRCGCGVPWVMAPTGLEYLVVGNV